jgi:hypothetical protein
MKAPEESRGGRLTVENRWIHRIVYAVTVNTPARHYLVAACASFVVLSPIAFFLSHPIWAFACRPSLTDEEIVAYCHSRQYGDYEHAAYFLNLEPALVDRFRQAEILFFGNSRLQFGLARPVAQAALAQYGTRVHSAAFSHNEAEPFATALVNQFHPRPRAVVINVDPFFSDQLSPVARAVLANSPMNTAAYRIKREMMYLQRRVCRSRPSNNWPCDGNAQVVIRKPNGSWSVDYLNADGKEPFTENENRYLNLLASSEKKAEKFLDLLGTNRSCVIFTSIPSPGSTRTLARNLAARLHVRYVAPALAGLATIDGTHLDHASANQWADAFFTEAGPLLRNCID